MGLVYSTDGDDIIMSLDERGDSGAVTNNYTVRDLTTNLQYPISLDSSPEYGQNRVLFFINVAGLSSISRGSDGAADRREQTYDLPQNEYYKASGTAAIDAAQDISAGNDVENSGILIGSIAEAINAIPTRKRLAAAISLYVPNTLTMSYNVNWSEEDLSVGNRIEQAVTQVVSGFKTNGVAGGATAAASAAASNIARQVLGGNSYAQKALGVTASNTQLEQLFKGVDFRSFQFDYDFAPRNEQEAEAVLQIIRMFRHHMLPEFLDTTQFLYVYPSEFEVKYYKGAAENSYLEKHITAVLTNCIINYTPSGQFNTFANGMPTQIRMQLQFKEIGMPSKETSPYYTSGA